MLEKSPTVNKDSEAYLIKRFNINNVKAEIKISKYKSI